MRITSTYVEKTYLFGALYDLDWDHLHIRGENDLLFLCVCCFLGSPPHTWRKLNAKDFAKQINRITSTYVEKTKMVDVYSDSPRDHLHIRGENPF